MNSHAEVALRMFDALRTRKLDDADEYIDPAFAHPETAQWSREEGVERFAANVRWLHSVFSDVGIDVVRVVEEGERVYVYLVMSGRHTGDLFGMAATGRCFFQEQVHVIDVRNGRAVYHQEWRSNLTALRQLGLAERTTP